MPRIGYADSPSFRRLRADDLQNSHLIAANHVHGRRCQCAEPSVGAGGTVVKREARKDAYQTAARVRLAL